MFSKLFYEKYLTIQNNNSGEQFFGSSMQQFVSTHNQQPRRVGASEESKQIESLNNVRLPGYSFKPLNVAETKVSFIINSLVFQINLLTFKISFADKKGYRTSGKSIFIWAKLLILLIKINY